MIRREQYVAPVASRSQQWLPVRWAESCDSEAILAFQARAAGGPLVLDRAPDLFRSYMTEGVSSKLLVSERQSSQAIVSCAALSFKELWLNGDPLPHRVGYLGSLLTESQDPRVLKEGFALIDAIGSPERPVLWLTSILAQNARALRTIGSGRSLFGARYSPLGRYTTYVMRAGAVADAIGSRANVSSFTVSQESQCDGMLHWQGYQPTSPAHPAIPAPFWRSLHHHDITRAVGALHDCRAVKRWRVNASPWKGALYSILLGFLSMVRDSPALSDLPRLVFLHGVAAHPDDSDGYAAMLAHLASCACDMYGRDVPLCIGVHESNPFLSLFRRIPSLTAQSCLFRVSLPHDKEFHLDDRPWHLDAGGL